MIAHMLFTPRASVRGSAMPARNAALRPCHRPAGPARVCDVETSRVAWNFCRRGLVGVVGAIVLSVVGCGGSSDSGLSESTGPQCPGGRRLDTSNPLLFGGVFTLSFGASVEVEKVAAPQMQVFASEVNRNCGLFIDGEGRGQAVEVQILDSLDQASFARQAVIELLPRPQNERRASLIVGAGGSEPTVPAVSRAVSHVVEDSAGNEIPTPVPFGINFALADSLSGCTAEQLAEPQVMKSRGPAYKRDGTECFEHQGMVLRTSGTSRQLGQTAARWMATDDDLRSITTAALMVRDDGQRGFGIATSDGFDITFTANGGTVLNKVDFPQNAAPEVLRDEIIELVATDPEIIVGVFRLGELRAFLQAWVALDEDPTFDKPPRWETVRFLNLGTLFDNYSDAGPRARRILSTRAIGITQNEDRDFVGYQRWVEASRLFDPNFMPTAHPEPKTYDLLMIWTLAMVKAGTTDGPAMAAEVSDIVNPPGTVFYPGQFNEARNALLAGEDIDYECAFGACDFDETTRQPLEVPFLVWKTELTGEPVVVDDTLVWTREVN